MTRRAAASTGWALLLFLAGAASAEAQSRDLLVSGWDEHRGWFSGSLSWAPSDPSLPSEVRIERTRAFLSGESETLSGRGRVRSNWVRGELKRPAGASAALDVAFGATAPDARPVILQVKLNLATGSAETISWLGGRRVSRARGRTVGATAVAPVASTSSHGHAEDPLDAYFVPLDRASLGEPGLEGTGAEGFRSWNGRPFVKGRSDAHAIDKNDVRQGALGNCYLLAAMISVAHSDPDVIERMIERNADGSYTVNLWDVGLFSEDARVRVEPSFPYQTRGGQPVPVFVSLGDRTTVRGRYVFELWPMIIEKAWATYRGGYLGTEDWHSSGPLAFISGAPVENLDPLDLSEAEIGRVLVEAVDEGYPTVLSTDDFDSRADLRSEAEDLGLIGFHAYSVVGKTADGRIRLWNPWGSQHPRRALTPGEFKRLFMCIHVGQF